MCPLSVMFSFITNCLLFVIPSPQGNVLPHNTEINTVASLQMQLSLVCSFFVLEFI